MSPSIEKTKKALIEIQNTIVSAIDVFQKNKSGMPQAYDLILIFAIASAAFADILQAWPELKTLTKEESAELGALVFDVINAIVDKFHSRPIK